MILRQATFQLENGDLVSIENISLIDTGLPPDEPGTDGANGKDHILKILVIDIGGKKFAAMNLQFSKRWQHELFIPVSNISWGSDGIATRVKNCLENANITHIAQVLMIERSNEHYRYKRRIEERRWMKNFGKLCYRRTQDVLQNLGIHLDIDLTDFPWDKLS